MRITESKLRRLIRDILIEAMTRRSFLRGLAGAGAAAAAASSLPSSASANPKINKLFKLKKKIADKKKKKGGRDKNEQLDALNAVFNELMSKSDDDLSINEIMQICMNNDLNARYERVIQKGLRGLSSGSSSSGGSSQAALHNNSTIDLHNSGKNPKLVIKVKGGFYYGYDSAFGDFYFKAKKEIVDEWIAFDQDKLASYDNEDPDFLDGLFFYRSVQSGKQNWMLEIGPMSPEYDSFLRQAKQQEKLKKEFNSI